MTDEEKGIFKEGFSDNFIMHVKELQRLDARSVRQPVFKEKLDYVFGQMAERYLCRMRASIGEPDVSRLSLDRALSYYVNGERGDPLLDYIVSRVRPLCELMYISPEAYGTSAFCTAVLMAQGKNREAYSMFSVMMRPLVGAYRKREDSGKRAGRPAHRHKSEALDIATEFRRDVPQASLYRTVQVVAGELARKYTDSPSARAIETWLKQMGYKR